MQPLQQPQQLQPHRDPTMSARCSLPLRRLLLCLLLASLAGETWASSCPQNWFFYRGHCYGYFSKGKTWEEAEKECERYGSRGRLASVHSLAERKVLANYIAKHRHNENVWIGLHDEEHERTWKWSDNSVLSFQSWAPGMPNNDYDNEDCVVLASYAEFQDWHDYHCGTHFPFICKYRL